MHATYICNYTSMVTIFATFDFFLKKSHACERIRLQHVIIIKEKSDISFTEMSAALCTYFIVMN